MAETTKWTIAEIDIKMNDAIANIKELKKQIESANAAKKASEGNKLSSEYISASANLKALNSELRSQENILAKVLTVEKNSTVSKKQLQNQNAILRDEISKLDVTNSEHITKIAQMNAQIDANNKIIDKNSDKQQKNRNNIGAYAEGMKEALNSTGIFGTATDVLFGKIDSLSGIFKSSSQNVEKLKGVFSDLRDKIFANTTATEANTAATTISAEKTVLNSAATEANTVAADVNTAATEANTAAQTTGAASSGIFATGLKLVGAAFNTLFGPVGLVIAAIASLVAYFTKSEEGMKAVKIGVSAVTAIFDTFISVLIKTGSLLADLFTGNWSKLGDDVKGIGSAFSQVGNNIKQNIDIQKQEMQLIKDKRKNIVDEATITRDVAKYRLDAADKTKTNTERINALKKALEGEKKLTEEKIKIAQQEYDIVYQRIKLEESQGKKASKEDKDRLADLEAAKINAQTEEYQRSKRAVTQLTTLENQLNDEKIAANKKAIETKYKNEVATAEALMLKEKDNTESRLNATINYLNKKQKQELANEELTQGERFLIEVKYNKEREKARNDYNEFVKKKNEELLQNQIETFEYELKKWELLNKSKIDSNSKLNAQIINDEIARITTIYEKEKKIKEDEISLLKDGSNEKKKAQEDFDLWKIEQEQNINSQTVSLSEKMTAQENSEKIEAAKRMYELDLELAGTNIKELNRLKLQQLKTDQKNEISAAKGNAEEIKKINQKYANAQVAISRAETQSKLTAYATFAENVATILGEGTKAGKAAAATATTINAIRGSIAAVTAGVEAYGLPWGAVYGAAEAGAIIASGVSAVKKIYATDGSSNSSDTTTSSTSTSTSSTTATTLSTTEAGITSGLISRTTETASNQNTIAVLVVDDVTNAQSMNTLKTKISSY